MLWLLGAYTELVKLMSARAQSKGSASYYASTASLALTGGGFAEFNALAKEVGTRYWRRLTSQVSSE